jgi:hypothetical protein
MNNPPLKLIGRTVLCLFSMYTRLNSQKLNNGQHGRVCTLQEVVVKDNRLHEWTIGYP